VIDAAAPRGSFTLRDGPRPVRQQTGAASGQQDVLPGCSFPSGDAVFTPATGDAILFDACAGSGVVAACTPTSGGAPLCGSADTTIPLVEPGGGVTPVPSGVAAIPTTTTVPAVVVADAANSTLSVVSYDGSSLATSTPISLAAGCQPATVAIGPLSVSGTATVYVACPGNGTIEAGTVSGTGTPALSSFSATSLPTTGIKTPAPYGIAVNQFGSALVVTDSANNDAVVYPFLSDTTLGTDTVVPVGTTPDGVGMDENNAFVANEMSDNVTVIDPPRSGDARGHIVARAHSSRAQRAPVSLSPLIAPLPTAAQR
jgi:DNA-binding beta-propeller fold protein YncE